MCGYNKDVITNPSEKRVQMSSVNKCVFCEKSEGNQLVSRHPITRRRVWHHAACWNNACFYDDEFYEALHSDGYDPDESVSESDPAAPEERLEELCEKDEVNVDKCCHCGFDGHQDHWFQYGSDSYCEACVEEGYQHQGGDVVCECDECQQELEELCEEDEDDIHCSQCNALTGTKNGAWAATCCSCKDITLCADCCPPGDGCHDGFCWSQAVEGEYPHKICLRCQEEEEEEEEEDEWNNSHCHRCENPVGEEVEWMEYHGAVVKECKDCKVVG